MVSRIEKEKENILKLLGEGKTYKEVAKLYGYNRTSAFIKSAVRCRIIPDKNGKYYEPKTYKCKYCNEEFDSAQKLGGHVTYCKSNPNIKKNLENLSEARKNIDFDKLIIENICKCKFCGKEVHGTGCLTLHEKHCHQNPNYVKKIVTPHGKSHPAWNKGKTALEDERIMRGANNRRKSIEEGKFVPKGTQHTEEAKELMRKKAISYIKKTHNGNFKQRFSIKACEYINSLNEEKQWNLQHAMNGGEVEICGYFLDGYDKEKNIAFEYDEPRHYENVYENILKERDVKRQNYIIEKTGCDFYRYNEKLELFYKVN